MQSQTIQNHLDAAINRYTKAHPLSRRAHQDATAHLPGGNTRTTVHSTPFPLTITSAQGAILKTIDNHTYVDFLSEYTAALLGHSNARITQVVQDTLKNGYNFGAPNQYEREHARLVCERFAPAMEMVRFTNSGTESNMLAIATAKEFTKRPQGKVLVFENGYHGSTIGFRDRGANDPMLLPHDWVVAPYGDIDNTREVLKGVKDGELAAVLVEPMQGSAGAIPCSPEFLKFLRAEATARGALLICDEVMTSRLAYSGLSQAMGVQPDLMTLGKWVGGGMTFGAFGGRKNIMSLFDPERAGGLVHGGTFNNNVVSMAAGCEALKIYDRETMEALNSLGEVLRERVNGVLRMFGLGSEGSKGEHKTCIWMSGQGSLIAMRFSGAEVDTLKALFWHHMLEQGIHLSPKGFMALNIEHHVEHVDRFVGGVESFCNSYLKLASPRAKL